MSDKISKISKFFLIFCFLFISCATDSFENFDRKLINKGYVETDDFSFPLEMLQKLISQDTEVYKPYVFEFQDTSSSNYTVIYSYFFDECSAEMINRYVKIILIDKNGFSKMYENENKNNEKGRAYVFNNSVYDKNGNRIENPIFYLWD
ncbi:MAG: hypothetical protein K6A89_09875 [Treponema sp.]|nr:hypothetical protein [Treponema sp.]